MMPSRITQLKIKCKKHKIVNAMATVGGAIYCQACLEEYWREHNSQDICVECGIDYIGVNS